MLILQSYLLIAYSLPECMILLYKDTSAVFSKTTFFQLEQPDSRPTIYSKNKNQELIVCRLSSITYFTLSIQIFWSRSATTIT